MSEHIPGPGFPAPKLADRLELEFRDYGILRHGWHNLAEIAPGVWRSNQPTMNRLARLKAQCGLRSVINLRGPRDWDAYYRIERHACAALGLKLHDLRLHARKAAAPEEYLRLIDAFREVKKPLLMHCKSGADRAGMAAALYLLAIQKRPLAEARRQLTWRHLHFRRSQTGILDHTLDLYAEDEARTGIGIEDWLRDRYAPETAMESFAALRGRR